MIEKKIKLGNLYDFYGNLLTEKQQEILTLYCLQDLSLGEISENLGISRQAVYDTLKRSKKILEDYEEKLRLFTKFSDTRNKVNDLIRYIDDFSSIIDNNHEKEDILKRVNTIKVTLLDILDEGL